MSGPAYLVVDVRWRDEAQHSKFVEPFLATLAKFGGKILSASDRPEIVLGQWKPRTLEIFEFPSAAAFRSWYGSQEFAPLLAIIREFADANVALIDGAD